MSKTPKRLRNFVFTLNNYKDADEARIKLNCEEGAFSYIIYGREVGESGTPHLQGYVELSKQRSFSVAKKLIGKSAHVERRRGTPLAASDYCRKDDKKPFVFGKISSPGVRTDLSKLRDDVKEGHSLETLMDQHDAAWRYLNATRTYMSFKTSKTFRKLTVTVHWGASGTGKTRAVFEAHPDVFFVPSIQNGSLWFNGYDGQDVILFDDFYGDISLPRMLRILDGYPLQLPVKGGFTRALYTKVYLTSNRDPTEWYHDPHGALERRITKTIKYSQRLG